MRGMFSLALPFELNLSCPLEHIVMERRNEPAPLAARSN
jgi:hypothetical protein